MYLENEYVIKAETMSLHSLFNETGEWNTLVHEQYRTLQIAKPLKTVLSDNCDKLGSSLTGKLDAAKKVLKNRRMLPLCLSTRYRICLFPTHSIDHQECVWFSVDHIRDIQEYKDGSIVILTNYQEIYCPLHPEQLYTRKSLASELIYNYMVNEAKLGEQKMYGFVADQSERYVTGSVDTFLH
ncbi:competence protein ComK [Metabacillus herbersteinensis]|uniref:Competence protein ComK n=1 Tax=Metabacillus herbersteinensis TaxID=283816 RepID=A0ABV6GEZ1_9BACI